jgi:hypothetical protein
MRHPQDVEGPHAPVAESNAISSSLSYLGGNVYPTWMDRRFSLRWAWRHQREGKQATQKVNIPSGIDIAIPRHHFARGVARCP